ncbi:hypothetical protein SLS59_002895 [Nothophoma quercina]|uniref:Uncharacterized protein n=1 Tax=Nothophoma quercina TaxID=749835 RepID=A0ABR3RRY1_9PLEO
MIALRSAPYAFNYFNKYTAWFPIRVEISMDLEGLWTVDMLLANNDQDPGMKINTLMFALGKARLAFDREEGLC